MGRRKSGVWRHFSEIEVDGITRAKCDACAQDLVSNPDRMQKHIDKCEAFKENNGPETSVPPQKKQTTLPINYLLKEPPYSTYLFTDDYSKVKPVVWWKTGRRLGFSDKLCDIAESIVGAIASTAGLERQFSTLGLTYGTLRTQLGVEKAGKLAFLYKQFNS